MQHEAYLIPETLAEIECLGGTVEFDPAGGAVLVSVSADADALTAAKIAVLAADMTVDGHAADPVVDRQGDAVVIRVFPHGMR